jgi:hypothetical protein
MGEMDQRREIIEGLSVDEAREWLALIGEEEVQHRYALHGYPNPTVRQTVNHILEKLHSDEKARRQLQRLQDDEVHRLREDVRKLAYRYPIERVHEQLLVDLNRLDEHWRAEHPDEPEPGIEYLRRVLAQVRQHDR